MQLTESFCVQPYKTKNRATGTGFLLLAWRVRLRVQANVDGGFFGGPIKLFGKFTERDEIGFK